MSHNDTRLYGATIGRPTITSASSTPTSSPFRRTIANYNLLTELGRGAYGYVYVARHKHTNHEYAMKIIECQDGAEKNGIPQHIMREISVLRILSREQNRHVIRLHDAITSTTDGKLSIYLLYDKFNYDLAAYLSRVPALSKERSLNIVYQVLLGLKFLHQHAIIHRDIKPQNILIDLKGLVVVADFGLARTLSLHASLTPNVVTLWYRSPELLLQCPYNSSVDIWALGIIIPEIFVKKPIFDKQLEQEMIQEIFRLFGSYADEDWPAGAVIASSSFPQRYPRRSISQVVTAFTKEELRDVANLVDGMLQYVPKDRPSASFCLDHPVFQQTAYEYTAGFS